ncbi:helix-turn-helix domain-containing protein [Escherichia coli]|uniref:helix-turn-helix domain-containing protein n=1 Tax=Escherichia coli TaxID=562 RepID=UPI001841FD48|nr:helix-turn-helix domain-containing protein [Escherichia coli]EFE0468904.1 helix-turn-helix domain-containing protein [Escherichia coli]MBB9841819.1 helix-turn-helix domain-containing protein [Escherichia coli]MBS9329556.1 helix-turn-helix domain-containing protein [Escherichia coli]MCZ9080045.1 helix-turn-helix domain-containing protein [Escherichia albertii]
MNKQDKPKKKVCIESIIKKIDSTLDRNWKIDELVINSGYSKRHIQTLFKQVTGMTIGKYIKKRKLSRAAIQIKFTNRPLFDIATDCQYATINAFYKAFKKNFNTTPKEFRQAQITDLSALQGRIKDRQESFKSLGIYTKKFILRGVDYLWPENIIQPPNKLSSRKKENLIRNILQTRESAYAVTHIHKKDATNDTVILRVFIGHEDSLGKFQSEKRNYYCFLFTGEWDDYIHAVRMLYMNAGFKKDDGAEIECYSYRDQPGSEKQNYTIKLYIPVVI